MRNLFSLTTIVLAIAVTLTTPGKLTSARSIPSKPSWRMSAWQQASWDVDMDELDEVEQVNTLSGIIVAGE
jgi:hypothetical protein